ncbi:hypothetical protein L2E82_27946 [Cichorium intybus]|uniref:Uncharacterized protein n=1 Tax=Cichorium intybus TaxID=13427 RepID=A0ACB9CUN9_CICIN|nr:hypothetical protein L2E82_27946 [Cichorium intybus]
MDISTVGTHGECPDETVHGECPDETVRKKSGDGTHGECPDETVTMPEDQAKDNGPDSTTVDYVKAGKAMEDPIVDGDEYVKAGKAMEDAAYGGDVSAAQSSPLNRNGCSTGIKNKEVHAYNKESY